MQSIAIKICKSVAEAPNYRTNGAGVKAAILKEAVIVRQGTEGGNDTIDLVFEDQEGNKYVALITATLLGNVLRMSSAVKQGPLPNN